MPQQPNHSTLSRRRVLGLFSGAAGLGAAATAAGSGGILKPVETAHWHGIALGGEASMTLVHQDGARARRVLQMAVTELERLEGVFSIYDPSSAVSRLNRDGYLSMPPMELVSLLSRAQHIHEASGGRFDVTVQPLWQNATNAVLVGQSRITVSPAEIRLGAGQAITLNGIAQGAITDALTNLLKREGFSDLLLNTGEIRALGLSPDGDAWRVALGDPDGPKVPLAGMAVATSARAAPKVHLFDPITGQAGARFESVSVLAPNATLADGLSTALALAPESNWQAILSRFANTSAYAVRLDGTRFFST